MNNKIPDESENLGSLVGNDFLDKPVPGINDESTTLVDSFVPTRYELVLILDHYNMELMRIFRSQETCGQIESREAQWRAFFCERLRLLETVLDV